MHRIRILKPASPTGIDIRGLASCLCPSILRPFPTSKNLLQGHGASQGVLQGATTLRSGEAPSRRAPRSTRGDPSPSSSRLPLTALFGCSAAATHLLPCVASTTSKASHLMARTLLTRTNLALKMPLHHTFPRRHPGDRPPLLSPLFLRPSHPNSARRRKRSASARSTVATLIAACTPNSSISPIRSFGTSSRRSTLRLGPYRRASGVWS